MILVSAGHHAPADKGACLGTICESDEALSWARLIVQFLHDAQVDVALVPPGPLRAKVHYINSIAPTLAIEIHFNSARDFSYRYVGRGCETLYHPKSPAGRLLAKALLDAIAPIFPPARGVKEAWYRQDKPGHVDYVGDVEGDEKLDYFVAATTCPAVIVEPQFIHLWQDIRAREMEGCRAIADCLIELARGTLFN